MGLTLNPDLQINVETATSGEVEEGIEQVDGVASGLCFCGRERCEKKTCSGCGKYDCKTQQNCGQCSCNTISN